MKYIVPIRGLLLALDSLLETARVDAKNWHPASAVRTETL